MKTGTTTLILKLVLILSFASACTKSRQAELPEDDQQNIFAISDFTLAEETPYSVNATSTTKELEDVSQTSALAEKPLVQIETEDAEIPSRLHFMFKDLAITSAAGEKVKITFAVDSKSVTAFKVVKSKSQLTAIEKQLAVSFKEVETAVAMQKAMSKTQSLKESQKALAQAKTDRMKMLSQNGDMTLLVPIFKYDIQAKGILKRTKNDQKEETATLKLKETDFDQATHIKISTAAADRKEIGSFEQVKELAQLFTASKIDNRVTSQGDLAADLNIRLEGKFKKSDSNVLSRLDAKDLKLYEILTESDLTSDQLRLLKAKAGNNEIMTCAEANLRSKTVGCVVVLRAKLPISYRQAKLSLAAGNGALTNKIELEETTKKESEGLVYIAKNTIVETVQSTGAIDPQNTLKISELKGEYLFRRTIEDASNAFLGSTGMSSDTFLVNFELQENRLVVRNTQTLAKYVGQSAKDREEIMSFEASYFKLQKKDEAGNTLLVPLLEKTKLNEAEYVQVNWLKNDIPDTSSPMAFYGFGRCLHSTASQQVTDPRIQLAEGLINFSIESSMTVQPGCAASLPLNEYGFWGNPTQFNFTVKERISFRKNIETANEILASSSPQVQTALNFNGITISEQNTAANAPTGTRSHESHIYKVAQHDFRGNKKLTYYIGGLETADPSRREILKKVTLDVVADWNKALSLAFKGTALQRSGDYVEAVFDTPENKGHLGDLDRSYIWYYDLPFENGALGVAQPSLHPRSAQITSSNVLMYPGNMADQLKRYQELVRKQREYEKLLEEVKEEKKKELLAEWEAMEKEVQAEEKAAALAGAAAATPGDAGVAALGANGAAAQAIAKTEIKPSFIQKVLISSRYNKAKMATSKFDRLSLKTISKKKVSSDTAKKIVGNKVRNQVADLNKRDFSKRILEKIFKDDLSKDRLMMEVIIAKEFHDTDPSLTPQAKAILQNKIQLNEMKARFEKNFKARFGCRIEGSPFDLAAVNDNFLNESWEQAFEGIMKWVLAHEMGHAFGLIHNFKGSIDKKNYAYEGEKTDRTYSTVMDYISYSESPYRGLGTYDVHAIRAIYTGYVELANHLLSKEGVESYFKKTATAGQLDQAAQQQLANQLKAQFTRVQSMPRLNDKFIKISDVPKLLGAQGVNYLTKESVARTNMLRHYEQCNDYDQGSDVRCRAYDWGSNATEVVKNNILSYKRSYITSYHLGDRINFGWNEKIAVMMQTIENFSDIRAYLDETIMLLMGKARSQEELGEFITAAFEGYAFFHEVIRIPDTNVGVGYSKDRNAYKQALKARLLPLLTTSEVYKKNEAGEVVTNAEGQPVVESVQKVVEFLEAKRVYDANVSTDKIDTIGIGFDKSFALNFLMQASPIAFGDDSQTGYISYLDFEKMFMSNYDKPGKSIVIQTIRDILTNKLAPGKFAGEHGLLTTANPQVEALTAMVTARLSKDKQPALPKIQRNLFLLNGAIQHATFGLNETKSRGHDAFAEYFKVGRSEGGATLKDRPSVRRAHTKANSQSAVRFWSTDNALGSQELVEEAALYEKIGENLMTLAEFSGDYISALDKVEAATDDPAQAGNLAKLKEELTEAEGKLLKIALDKLNFDGQFNDKEKSAEELVMELMKENAKQARLSALIFTNIAASLSKEDKVTLAEMKQGLQADDSFKEGVSLAVKESALGALAQMTALQLLNAKEVKVTIGNDSELAGKFLAETIVQPLPFIQEVLDEKVGILEDLSMLTIYLNPEFKR